MTLHEPFSISSRLLPALKIGDGTLSLEYVRTNSEGRDVYRWYADLPSGEYSAADLKSGCQGGTLQEMFEALLDFLCAAAESYSYGMRTGTPGENADLFPPEVVEWAYQHSDEIGMIRLEIDESESELIEE